MKQEPWCEVWIDRGLDPPYVLLVMPNESGCVVRDPQNGTIAHEGRDYETVKLWLLEDEFTQVDGRMTDEYI